MPYTAEGYARRAAECTRLAALTADDKLQQELLRMRQSYLRLAEKLGLPMHEAIAISRRVMRGPRKQQGRGSGEL
jgi:hypothetical protein